ncbi:DNA-binding transcriptional LysR family regulator [Paraburkholderia sp. Clong3]
MGRPFEWEFHRGKEVVSIPVSGRLLVSDVGTMLNACVAGAGIAQVMSIGTDSACTARPCRSVSGLVVVANPGLARPADGSSVPAVLRGGHDRIASWDVTGLKGKSRISIKPVAYLSSLIMVRDTVRLGVGAASLPLSLVSHDIAAGRLTHWGDLDGPDIALWALYPSRRLLSPRVSAFLDHIKEAFPLGKREELAGFIGSEP